MGRLRASLSRSEADRELHEEIARAVRALVKAQDVCLRVARDRSPDPLHRIMAGRAKAIQGTLGQVRGLLERIGSLVPGYDTTDLDLVAAHNPEVAPSRPETAPKPKPEPKARQIHSARVREILERMRQEAEEAEAGEVEANLTVKRMRDDEDGEEQ